MERTELPNGNIRIHIGARTLFCGSQAELDALAVFLGDMRQEALESAAERLDTAYATIEAYRAIERMHEHNAIWYATFGTDRAA